jgi:hypothetical protein
LFRKLVCVLLMSGKNRKRPLLSSANFSFPDLYTSSLSRLLLSPFLLLSCHLVRSFLCSLMLSPLLSFALLPNPYFYTSFPALLCPPLLSSLFFGSPSLISVILRSLMLYSVLLCSLLLFSAPHCSPLCSSALICAPLLSSALLLRSSLLP